MIPVAEYGSAEEMMAAYRARRSRASASSRVINIRLDQVTAENEAIRAELAKANATIERQKHEISEYQGAALEYLREMAELRGELFGDLDASRRSIPEIVTEVLRDFPGMTLQDLRSASRSRALCAARHAAIYAVHTERDDLSYPRIGQFFGRDHTTAIHAVRKVEAEIKARERG